MRQVRQSYSIPAIVMGRGGLLPQQRMKLKATNEPFANLLRKLHITAAEAVYQKGLEAQVAAKLSGKPLQGAMGTSAKATTEFMEARGMRQSATAVRRLAEEAD